MASQNSQKPQGLPNPYAQSGLPNPYAQATVASSAPVKFTEEQAKAEQQKKAPASHFHNPHTIKRPQAKKAGPTVKKPLMPTVSAGVTEQAPAASTAQQHGIDYYRSTVDDDAAILEERRQRQYDERQRKKDMKKFHKQFGYWNPMAPHKPERYSNLKAYRASGGYTRKKDDFNAFLRQAAAQSSGSREASETSDPSRPGSSSSSQPAPTGAVKPSFAPPASYDSAPVEVEGGDRFARRVRLSQQQQQQQQQQQAPPPPPASTDLASTPPPPPPPPEPSNAAPQARYHGATISAPPVRYNNPTISAPPLRFEHPDIPMGDADEPAHDERPAKRPKTLSKAEAMMAKMGYVKGQGLGKNSDGVVTHLEVKRRKAPPKGSVDDEGGKVKSQTVWDVHGGLRNHKDEPSKFGDESTVVVAWGCVDGIDWAENARRDDGGIRQDMGEVFSAKFGPVQQVQIDEGNKDGVVYVKFESVMSALNAVNRFDEGFEFQGRKIRARYYDEKKWHSGIWEH